MQCDKAAQYLRLATSVAADYSRDPDTKVGALLLHPKSLRVLSLGYNGMPRGVDDTRAERWTREAKATFVEHAARNCLYNACRHGTPTDGAICVVSRFPCVDCVRALVQAGAKTLIAPDPAERDRAARDMLDECNVRVVCPAVVT